MIDCFQMVSVFDSQWCRLLAHLPTASSVWKWHGCRHLLTVLNL